MFGILITKLHSMLYYFFYSDSSIVKPETESTSDLDIVFLSPIMFLRSGIAASAVLLIFVMTSGEALECSKSTNDEGPQKDTACVFPFIFKRKSHTECTNLSDPGKNLTELKMLLTIS